ncbi:unnamed protein product [Urochloa decumbens]|uniref:Cytochrome P450 n=1 Tax=Urochloa decumbens TaxID=240449 RepID=A0ABC9B334_9POAL
MLLRLGTVPNLIVSSPHAAQAVLRTHDNVFASRPPSIVVDNLQYGPSSNFGGAPYGEHWRQVRKFVSTHLLTAKKVNSYHLARQEEVRLVMAKLRKAAAASAEVDISEMVNAFSNDVVCHAVSGKFFRAEGRNKLFRELIVVNATLSSGFVLENYFPGVAILLGMFTTWFMKNKVAEAHRRWDELLENIICDHERRSSKHRGDSADQEQSAADFIDVMLSVQQEYGITMESVKSILMDIFDAGTNTSSLVLEYAMVELMRNPYIRTKLQDEVRKMTPKGQEIVSEDNLASMSYLRAVVKETLRLHPPAPLLLPHQSMADCDIDGYTIPSGTRVIINSWAINRDPESWENADEFIPERFMDGGSAVDIDFKGNNFQFIPFGAGRRMCPGLNFGLATVEIMLANLMYCFDWDLPAGMDKEDIDMTEVFGLTVHRKEKLVLVPKEHGTVPHGM